MKAPWFSLTKAAGNHPNKVRIFGEIGYDVTGEAFTDHIESLSGDIEIHINSLGGNVSAGLMIYHALNQYEGNVLIVIEGFCGSISSMIAMAGNRIEMHEESLFMIHNPSTIAAGTSSDFEKTAETLNKVRDVMVSAYLKRSVFDEAEIISAMDEETWFNAAEALEAGFVDEVIPSDLDMAACATEVDLTGFKNTPEFAAKADETAADPAVNTPAKADPNPAHSATQTEHVTMPDQVTAEAQAAIDKFKVEDKTRRDGITAAFKPFPALSELQASCIGDMDCSIESAREKMLAKLGEDSEAVSRVHIVEDSQDKFRAGVTASLSARAGVKGAKDDTANEFRGFKLMDIARECVIRAGGSARGLRGIELAKAAFAHTGSDFPFLMQDVGNKVLLAAYNAHSATWRMIALVGEVSDFKLHNRVRLGQMGALPIVPDGAEYDHNTFGEENEQIAAATRGNIISLTRQTIINDDLGGFTRIARMQGRAAALTVEMAAYSVLNDNANMSDGVALFHADHNNLTTGAAAINSANISAGKAAMRKQKFEDSDDEYLDIRSANLLVPVELEDEAKTFITSTTESDQDNPGRRNIHANSLEVVASPYHGNATQWYLGADPMDAPVVEVVFLDGVEEPFLDSQEGFNVDGVAWKVRLDVGTGATDSRGMHKFNNA